MSSLPPVTPILLVEDSPEDVEMLRRIISAVDERIPIHHAWDGEGALEMLRSPLGTSRAGGEHPVPLVLLDLNLPGLDGRDVLRVIKSDHELSITPVVVLTSSREPEDIDSAYRAGADGYVQKPFDPDLFEAHVRAIKQYWIDTVVPPSRSDD